MDDWYGYEDAAAWGMALGLFTANIIYLTMFFLVLR